MQTCHKNSFIRMRKMAYHITLSWALCAILTRCFELLFNMLLLGIALKYEIKLKQLIFLRTLNIFIILKDIPPQSLVSPQRLKIFFLFSYYHIAPSIAVGARFLSEFFQSTQSAKRVPPQHPCPPLPQLPPWPQQIASHQWRWLKMRMAAAGFKFNNFLLRSRRRR